MPEKPNRLSTRFWFGLLILLLLSACAGDQQTQEILSSPLAQEEKHSTVLPSQIITQTPVIISGSPPPSLQPQSLECLDQSGSIIRYQIAENVAELSGTIYLPPCYGMDPEQRYPTLYLLHGTTETDQQWGTLGIKKVADRLIAGSSIPPMIIVMPLELTWVELPENPFGNYLVAELIPWIDHEYLTLTDRENRAIGGLSRGGNWAVRIGLLHWGLFDSIGAHSTPLFYGDLNRMPGWIEGIPVARLPRIYLDIGRDDTNLEAAENFLEILSELEVPYSWIINPGLHDEIYWSDHLEEYLLWYGSGWQDLVDN
jgi:enterochelin esterase-like enzyme